MHILIVGCGYLGLRAAQVWLEAGHSVTALTRNSVRAAEWKSIGLKPVIGDVLDTDSLSALPAADVCLHAVGYDRQAAADKRTVYVTGLQNVLEKLQGRVSRLIYISSSSVYGQDNGEIVDENSPCEPISEGGRICLAAESILREYFPEKSDAVSGVILRLSGIYGPGRLIGRQDQLKQGLPLTGNPLAWLNLIHVDDAVRAILVLASMPSPPLCSLLSDAHPLRRGEFFEALASRIGAPVPVFNQADDQAFNKRCDSRQLLKNLSLELKYPSAIEALNQLLSTTESGHEA